MKLGGQCCLLIVIAVQTILLLIFACSSFSFDIFKEHFHHARRHLNKIFDVHEELKLPQYICSEPDIKENNNRVISYSLFGRNAWKRYGSELKNIIREIKKLKEFRSWTIRVYHDGLTIKNTTSFKQKGNVVFCNVKHLNKLGNIEHKNGHIWRFIPISDPTVDIVCVRDLDSPILKRDQDAVYEWIRTDKIFHVIRDHHSHVQFKILGGLWCFRNSKNRTLGSDLWNTIYIKSDNRTHIYEARYSNDQSVLGDYVWPVIKNDVVQHDSYGCNDFRGVLPFPSKRIGYEFVGCIRPCDEYIRTCPYDCRPKLHKEWHKC